MPRSVVYVVFMVPEMFSSPNKRALFGIFTDTFIEKITAEIGHEAVLADIEYSIKGFED